MRKKKKFDPPREYVAKVVREYLAQGGKIKKVEVLPDMPVNFAVKEDFGHRT